MALDFSFRVRLTKHAQQLRHYFYALQMKRFHGKIPSIVAFSEWNTIIWLQTILRNFLNCHKTSLISFLTFLYSSSTTGLAANPAYRCFLVICHPFHSCCTCDQRSMYWLFSLLTFYTVSQCFSKVRNISFGFFLTPFHKNAKKHYSKLSTVVRWGRPTRLSPLFASQFSGNSYRRAHHDWW